MQKRFMREVKIPCSDNYMEVDIFPISQKQKNMPRGSKVTASRELQVNLNDKNAKRYLVQLINANFDERDLHITKTYSDDMLPDNVEKVERDRDNYLRRVAYACKKRGLPKPLYVCVIEYREGTEDEKAVRFHIHLILKCELSRDELEAMWTRGGVKLGFVNADRLQMDKYSLERLAKYLLKYPNRRRRWKQSKGLKKPERKRPNDGKYTKRAIERIVKNGECYNGDFWHKKYEGWELSECVPVWNECMGEWSVYLKLWRKIAKR